MDGAIDRMWALDVRGCTVLLDLRERKYPFSICIEGSDNWFVVDDEYSSTHHRDDWLHDQKMASRTAEKTLMDRGILPSEIPFIVFCDTSLLGSAGMFETAKGRRI